MELGVSWYWAWEERLIVWMQQLGAGGPLQGILHFLNNLFSFMGEEMMCIAVMGLVYWGFDKKKGERIGAAVMMVNVSIGLLKNIFSRIRPWQDSEKILLLREVDGYSFPSGHSANCTSLYPTAAAEYPEKKWLRWAAILVPLLCGVSRCYVGAHWPTDVIVGLSVGLLIFFVTEQVLRRLKNKYVFYLILIGVSCVGLFYCKTNDYFNSLGMLVGFVGGLRFEEKHTRFENTKNVGLAILRTVMGGALYFVLSTLIKLVIGGIFEEGSFGYLLMRSVRYGLVVFLLIGVYPYAFRLEKKLGRKKEAAGE